MAEGGPGRSRNFWGSRFGPRSRESRVCKFYLQGNCFYGENCRFRHMDTSYRFMQEDHTFSQGEHNDAWSQPKALKERKAKETSDEAKPNISLGAGSRSSEEDRVHVSEFVPLAQETHSGSGSSFTEKPNEDGKEASNSTSSEGCSSFSLMCHTFSKTTLDPSNDEKRTKDVSECIDKPERDAEVSVTFQKSKDKSCGICFEVIMEKADGGRRFGILPNCNHCFCLACIRKWRRAIDFDSDITRACPECRVSSDYVCPSFYWVESKEEKEKLITDYKEALSEKDCKYFRSRRGRCPFGDKCFYKHTSPAGAGVQPCARRPFRRRRRNVDVEFDVNSLICLWDFLMHDHDSDWSIDFEDFEPGLSFLNDSNDSDW